MKLSAISGSETLFAENETSKQRREYQLAQKTTSDSMEEKQAKIIRKTKLEYRHESIEKAIFGFFKPSSFY